MFFHQPKRSAGFTLIETLLVLAIIALLTSIALAGYEEVKKSTRNAARLAHVKQLELALELYLADNGSYPQRNATLKSHQCTPAEIAENTNWVGLVDDLSPYMRLTGDPFCNKGESGFNYYYVANSGDGYRTYGAMLKFESPCTSIDAENDGGNYSYSQCIWYEFGQQPKFCEDQNKSWLNGDSPNVCD